MSDAIPAQLDSEITVADVAEALRRVRVATLEPLGALPLAHHPLVAACRLAEEPETDDVRALLLKELLHWAVDRLCPSPPPSPADEIWHDASHPHWQAEAYRLYNVLYYPYFTEWTFATVARRMKVTEAAIYKKPSGFRPRALAEVVELLQREAQTGQHLAERQRYTHHARWATLPSDAHLLLTRAAPLRVSFSPGILYHCENETALSAEILDALCTAGLLRRDEHGDAFMMDSSFRTYLLSLLSSEERQAGHELAARYHKASQPTNHLEVAYHLYHLGSTADEPTAAVQAAIVLIEQWEGVVRQHTWQEITEVLALFERSALPPHLWFQVKLLEGDAALAAEKVTQAIDAYTAAYREGGIEIRAAAAHRLGKAYKRFAPQDARHYYERCSDLLRDIATPSPFLVPVFVDRAWSFIQEERDLEEAERLLTLAQKFIEQQGSDKALEAKLHNAWAGLYVPKKKPEEVLAHRWQAYLAAQEGQDREFEIKIAKNLGFDYAQLQQRYDLALHFLERASMLAIQAGERQLEGLCLKDMGNCYFWQRDYSKAIEHYRKANGIFKEGNNRNWRTAVCLELTEAHAEAHAGEKARHYFKKGRKLAKKLKHSDYLAFVKYLLKQYPNLRVLDLTLNPRQVWAADEVARAGFITCAAHRAHHDCSPKSANRDMNELCEKGLFVAVGKARATVYRFAPSPDEPREATP